MLSSYSKGDVSVGVERLIRALLRKYPTLMFTVSAVAQELKDFRPADVRDALLRESERGLLEPYLQWRCQECDSPARDAIDSNEALGYCHGCEIERPYDSVLYFRATNALMRDLDDPPGDDPKKGKAATEESVDRVAEASRSPQSLDILPGSERSRLLQHMENVASHTERMAKATEAALPHAKATAEATTRMSHDWRPFALTAVGILLATVIGVATFIVTTRPHFFDKYFPKAEPSAKASAPIAPRRRPDKRE